MTNCSTLDVAAALEPPLNVLTNVKKNFKRVKESSPETKVVFSGLIVRKNKDNVHKDVMPD